METAHADDPVLFINVLRTTQKHIYDITQTFYAKFLQSKEYKESPFRRLNLEKMVFNNNTIQLHFVDRYYDDFGGIGYVEVMPINDVEAQIRVFCYDRSQYILEKKTKLVEGNLPTEAKQDFLDEMEGEENFYKAGRDLLTALANRLSQLFSSQVQPNHSISNSMNIATTQEIDASSLRIKGRYRLTKEDIEHRKNIVLQARVLRAENPYKLWAEIANELDIPERTLRDWRHNPLYQ